ncbi:MAG: hypothetical protein K8R46_11180 [Pirellulales bacterium]|nr:hypothetical protein [Pirellulales bacterium]
MTVELMVFSSRRLDYVANRIREYSQLRIPDGNYLDRQAFIDEVLRHKMLSIRRFLKLAEKHKRPRVCWYGDNGALMLVGADGRLSVRLAEQADGVWEGYTCGKKRGYVRLMPCRVGSEANQLENTP